MNLYSIKPEWLPAYTYQDYKNWEGDWELIHGIPYAMSPAPGWRHQHLGGLFITEVNIQLRKNGSGCTCKALYETDWVIDENTTVRPDIMIVCAELKEQSVTSPPVLALEIFSDSSRLKDRNLKFRLYEESGVKYYLMADPDQTSIEAFILKDNRYTSFDLPATLPLTDNCAITLDVAAMWKGL